MSSYEVTGSITPDKLIAGSEVELLTKIITLKSGQGTLKRGSVIGEIEKSVGTPVLTGTGNGTMTAVSIGKDAIIGNYKVICITAVTDLGNFSVIDPNGNRLADAVVGTAYTSSQINFTINDGSTDFTAGATFTIPVTASSDAGKGKLCDANSIDGSQLPKYILLADTVTTSDAKATVAKTGYYNRDELTYGTNGAPTDAELNLKKVGIYLADQIAY
jgi:hypothetical protein